MKFHTQTHKAIWLMIALAYPVSLSANNEWNQFRGYQGRGYILSEGLDSSRPLDLNDLNWKVKLGRGHSSPVLFGELLILTTFEDGNFYVRALSQENGELAWSWKTRPNEVEKGHRNGSPAASSVAISDSGKIVAYSGSFGLVCLDSQGDEIWRRDLPTPVTQHGSGTSPVISDNKVILCVDQDLNSHLLCLSLDDGKRIWKTRRDGFRRGFSTPLVWKDVKGVNSVFTLGTLRAVNYSLENGEELWSVSGLPNETCSTPVFFENKIYLAAWTYGVGVSRIPAFAELLQEGDQNNDGVLSRAEAPPGSPARMHFPYVDADKNNVITASEYDSLADIFRNSKNVLMAINVSNGAEVSPNVIWKFTKGLPYVPSPIVYQGNVYIVKNGGMVSSFDHKTGEIHFQQERLGAVGDYYSSPIAIGNRILFVSQPGTVTEIKASKQFEIVSQIKLEEPVFATPAVTKDSLFIRTSGSLFSFKIN